MSDDPLYFRQLLCGRELATSHPAAGQMANFMYLIGDTKSRQAMVVDPAWDIETLVDLAEADGYEITGALVTHYHPDHVGGDLFGLSIQGVTALLERVSVPLYVNKHEAHGVGVVTGVSESDMKKVDDGDVTRIGEVEVKFLHTPGHTPGSQCFLVGDRLIAGDTLFVQGCGRVDLPGGDPEAMYHTLTGKLAKLPAETVLFPGHNYGPTPTSTLEAERRQNHYLQMPSIEAWLQLMGGD